MKLRLHAQSRARVLAWIVVAVMAVFVGRLFWIQIVQHRHYLSLADREQLKRLVIPARRGEIYALDQGSPVRLVLNETIYTVFADPQVVTQPDRAEQVLRQVAGGTLVDDVATRLRKDGSRYQVVARQVTRRQAELIKQAKLAGIGFQAGTRRVYPEGRLAAQTLGFVNGEGRGQYGVEQYLNDRLTGRDGLLQAVTDVSNVPLTIGNRNIRVPAQHGQDIVLSLDRNIQAYSEKALAAGMQRTGAKQGSVLVMDPQTGRVLAMTNAPSFAPAEYAKVTDPAAFVNGVVAVPYEAGSVIKTMTVSAGLDRGVIKADSTYTNTDSIKVGDRVIQNLSKGQTGTITMQKALDWSLNTGMVVIAQRLGGGDGRSLTRQSRQVLYEYYHQRFGIAQRTGIEVTGEAGGVIIPPDDGRASPLQYATMTFGQGMTATMIQVAAGFGSMINGGTYYQPTVLAGTIKDGTYHPSRPKVVRQTVSPSTSQQVRAMTRAARQAFYASNDRPGYEVGGKTGTSQVAVAGGYSDKESIGTYLGYGGDSTPRYVIMVQLSGKDQLLGGGKDAGPIFTDLSNWMIDYLKLQPKGL